MKKSGDADVVNILLGHLHIFGNDHRHGSDVYTMLEGVFIACFQGTDIHGYSSVVINGTHQIAGDRGRCLAKMRIVGIAVQMLYSFRNTFFYTDGKAHLGGICLAVFSNIVFGNGRSRLSNRRGILIIFSLPDIHTIDIKFFECLNLVFIQIRAAYDQGMPPAVFNLLIDPHPLAEISCSHKISFYHILTAFMYKIYL